MVNENIQWRPRVWCRFQCTIRLCIQTIWSYLIGMAAHIWCRLLSVILLFIIVTFYLLLYIKIHYNMERARLAHCPVDSSKIGSNRISCSVSRESDVSGSGLPNTSVESKTGWMRISRKTKNRQQNLEPENSIHVGIQENNTLMGRTTLSTENQRKEIENALDMLERNSTIIVDEKMADYSTVDCSESTTCGRFKRHMLTWPANKPRAAIYVLCGGRNQATLTYMIYSLFQYFNARFEYPVIVFYTSEEAPKAYDMTTDGEFVSKIKHNVFFQQIRFLQPRYFPTVGHARRPRHGVSYRHMCRFHAKLVYTHPIMTDLEFAWRLDEDSQILAPPINYDIFKFMQENDLIYGFRHIWLDSPLYVARLWNSVKQYSENANIKPKFCWPHRKIFYNNFEVSRQSLWRSKEYEDYFNFIDSLGGIYKYRWGDAPIKSLALSLFVSPNKVHLFGDIGYMHQKARLKGVARAKIHVTTLSEVLRCLNNTKHGL